LIAMKNSAMKIGVATVTMKNTRQPLWIASCAALIFAFALVAAPAAHAQSVYAITGAKVYPISGPPIEGATVVIRDGKIAAVGKGVSVPSGAKVLEARGLEVYPGMFNAITEMGLNEIGEGVPGSVDTHELGEFNPDLVAETAVNSESAHIPVVRVSGITHVISAPGVGGGGFGGGGAEIIGGQASLLNLAGWTPAEMDVRRSAAMIVNWPNLPSGGGRGGFGGNQQSPQEARQAYQKHIDDLSDWLDRARHYALAMHNGSVSDEQRDLKLEALVPVVKGDLPLFIITEDPRGIRDAVAFCDKNKVKMILGTGTAALEVKDLLKEKSIPVVLQPTLSLVREEDDPYDLSLAMAGQLDAAGIKIAFGSYTNEFARRLSQQAGNSVAFGLSREEALKALTLYPAQMFGVDKELGTIEPGKMANLVVTNGDLLELNTEVKYLFIKGQLTSLDNRNLQLYEKYRKRP